jgi:hypothetical protein
MSFKAHLNEMNWKRINKKRLFVYLWNLITYFYLDIRAFAMIADLFSTYENSKKYLKILILKSESEVKEPV